MKMSFQGEKTALAAFLVPEGNRDHSALRFMTASIALVLSLASSFGPGFPRGKKTSKTPLRCRQEGQAGFPWRRKGK
jgi:hypothetical protein